MGAFFTIGGFFLKVGDKILFWDRENQLFWELYGPLQLVNYIVSVNWQTFFYYLVLSGFRDSSIIFYLVLSGLGTAALFYYLVLSGLETAALFY